MPPVTPAYVKDIWRPCLSSASALRCGEALRFRSRYTRSTSPWYRVVLLESTSEFWNGIWHKKRRGQSLMLFRIANLMWSGWQWLQIYVINICWPSLNGWLWALSPPIHSRDSSSELMLNLTLTLDAAEEIWVQATWRKGKHRCFAYTAIVEMMQIQLKTDKLSSLRVKEAYRLDCGH